jgi:serine/threonine protein kinase
MIEEEQWKDTTFLVTEPWAPASLQRFLQDVANEGRSSSCPWYRPQTLDPWLSIVKQCILGLKHLHENSIKHKDLKPDNILLLDESKGDFQHPKVRPIIADLGISKEYILGAGTTFQGTHQYLAPEQIAEEASTLESDIFSLGCCFAWIHSVICSEQGPAQLDELVCVGFAGRAGEVPSLLERLRVDNKGPWMSKTREFLKTMEEMISSMLIAAPGNRPKLESLLELLDTDRDYSEFSFWSDRLLQLQKEIVKSEANARVSRALIILSILILFWQMYEVQGLILLPNLNYKS